MRKLIAALITLIALPLALSACGPAEAARPADSKPVTHTGTWKAEGFEGTVTADTIEIKIVSPDTKSLYWKGTFHEGSDVVKSMADTEVLAASMLGSQDASKNFAVDDNEISFDITLMGTTKTVHLKRA